MSKLSLVLAEKLLRLAAGERIPASQLKYSVVQDMLVEGILYRPGKRNSIIQLVDHEQLDLYLQNRFSIRDLNTYVDVLKKESLIRADLTAVATDSKLRAIRTFKGFLVNSFDPVACRLNNKNLIILPSEGTFTFIYDYERFIPDENITIVGIENPENFRHIAKQKHLFKHINPLFISRYPQNQNKDLVRWLKSISNQYVHFGDFDFAGIAIFLHEFNKHIPQKSTFFIPTNIDEILDRYGNRERYNTQKITFEVKHIQQPSLVNLIDLIHKHKKGLDQEVLINKI